MIDRKDIAWIYYGALIVVGLAIIFTVSIFHQVKPASQGEYYYSNFLRDNFTWPAIVLCVLVAFVAGYVYKLNPLLAGICLLLIFPVTTIVEAIIYPGSHNLIPFELAIQFLMTLPFILVTYIGTLVAKKRLKQKQRIN